MTTIDTTPSLTVGTVGHVGINVTDLDRSAAFYASVLGLEVTKREVAPGLQHAFLSDRGERLVTLWQQADAPFSPGAAGLHHLAFRVGSVDEVHEVEARVRGLGLDLVHDGVVAHAEGAASGGIFFLDPDGTRLEVYSPDAGASAPAPSGDAPTCGFF